MTEHFFSGKIQSFRIFVSRETRYQLIVRNFQRLKCLITVEGD